jgi:hypothetical protein
MVPFVSDSVTFSWRFATNGYEAAGGGEKLAVFFGLLARSFGA